MKAKEMAAQFNAAPTLDDRRKVVSELVRESIIGTKALAEQRHIKSDSGLAVILREADERWRAFARLCPDVNPDAFKICLHQAIPDSALLLP